MLAVEEAASPYHEQLKTMSTLEGIPVVAAPLHSMLPGVILGFRALWQSHAGVRSLANRNPKVVYVMTDGAALPLALSDLVRELKGRNFLDVTITTGHAFGGDLEAVSIPSALLAARQVVKADLIIVALGPGIVGTGTTLGFSSIEQSWVIDLATRMKGYPIIVPRISEAETRARHSGISHQTLTILDLANHSAALPVSNLLPTKLKHRVIGQLQECGLLVKHLALATDDPPVEQIFQAAHLEVKSMGRSVNEDPAFFQTSIAAGFLAAKVFNGDLASLTRIH